MSRLLALLAMLLSPLALAAPATQPAKTRVIIITGVDHPAHNWKQTAPALKKLLEADPRLSVTITEDPKFLASPKLADYDVALIHFMPWNAPDPGDGARAGLQKFVSSGHGLVVLHFGCGAFYQWPEYTKMIGRVYDPKLPPHDVRGPFKVDLVNADHPITAGLPSFDTDDELYTCLTGDTPIKLLATAHSQVTKKDEPMAFTLDYGKGRVFLTTLGHDTKALAPATLHTILRRACLWTAQRDPAELTMEYLEGEPFGTCVVRDRGRRLFQYGISEGVSSKKPYVGCLYTPQGVNVLRDSPSDHKHHHGLMYAMIVNGINYWEEVGVAGTQVEYCHSSLMEKGTGVVMEDFLTWRPPRGEASLSEIRSITAYTSGLDATLMTWTGTFHARSEETTLSGNHYHGLGMRFPESLDKSKPHFFTANGENLGDTVRGTEKLGKSTWFAVHGTIDNKPVTIALFDHPSNPRPALFFTMTDPFAYLSATINLWKQPLTLTPGQSLTLTYGIAAWDGHREPAQIQRLRDRWLELTTTQEKPR